MASIAVIAAHPDDEALGCGGTLWKHRRQGEEIHLLYMTDGASARGADGLAERHAGLTAAMKLLQPASFTALDFPDNRLDTVPLLDVARAVEEFARRVQPSAVYTHFAGDLNVDHGVTTRAVLTAFRPQPGSTVRRIAGFEVLSSTEWALPGSSFQPNWFVDISPTFADKQKLLACYNGEMRAAPHARSHANVEALARFRGHSVGLEMAEAFQLIRAIA